MQRFAFKSGRRGLAVLAVLGVTGITAFTGTTATPASAVTPPSVGIVCDNGTVTGTTTAYNMSTDSGYINLPDGNTAFMLGYKLAGKAFQHPGPVLCVTQGQTVSITLTNTLNRDVSMMFPGQSNVLANGVAAQPQFDTGGTLTSLTNIAAKNGGSVTYSFTAGSPGTFLYQSGTDPDVQTRVGLFGALIVRPTAGVDHANNRPDSIFTTMVNTNTGVHNPNVRNDEEFMMMLSEVDPYLNQSVELGKTFNMNNYHPRYWLVNGRGFPDSIADNNASWLPAQPYGSLARVKEKQPDNTKAGYHPYAGLVRYLNVGTEDYPFHPHGNNGKVIARDGHPLEGPLGEDLSYEKFSLNIGPGQTWDVQFEWFDAEHYNPTTNQVPVTVPQVASQVFGMFYSGSPYLGQTGPQPPGNQSLNQCGEFYIIAHNHALFQITSWGVNMTGPITYMRIDPADTSNCP
jgi:FtsP/CotA-like multicopper oxidase with cupredoxin domain